MDINDFCNEIREEIEQAADLISVYEADDVPIPIAKNIINLATAVFSSYDYPPDMYRCILASLATAFQMGVEYGKVCNDNQ